MGLGALLMLGLGLRLLVWRWHEQYPLGGDEREYFEQALTWLQGKGYRELPLMRPPLYTVFLAIVFQLFDSQVQRVRLVQALVSTGMIGLMWLWARAALGVTQSRAALVATGLTAICFTFAANATELLTETLFIAGLTLAFWLIARAAGSPDPAMSESGTWRWAALAGLVVGLLSLVRSVALPLVPLASLWLLLQHPGLPWRLLRNRRSLVLPISFALCAALVILPWTLRNYLVYATPIVIDTTGAENLWLDNALTDRETVKRELYALGEDRGARQRLALQQGLAAISAEPERFWAKAWREAKTFVSLEYFDDLRRRPAIWVSPPEVWLRLLLGDGVWLLVLLGGIAGLWLGPHARLKWLLVPWVLYVLLTGLLFHVELRYRLPIYPALLPYAGWSLVRVGGWLRARLGDGVWLLVLLGGIAGLWLGPHARLKWLLVPWVLYVLLTGLLFHVELRYRLPIYPALLPYAGWSLVRVGGWLRARPRRALRSSIHGWGALATVAAVLTLLLLHRPYMAEAALLLRKHLHLAQARRLAPPGERAAWNVAGARAHAQAALDLDPPSALARVELGRLAEPGQATEWWQSAIEALPAHPYAHLLLGNALRRAGDDSTARRELEFETASLEDLQQWALLMFEREPQSSIDVGNGLDLGLVTDFYPAAEHARWTKGTATVHQVAPGTELSLRLRSPRPPAAPPALVRVVLENALIGTLEVGADWQTYTLAVPEPLRSTATAWTVRLETPTFRPRAYDRGSGDNRALGVQADWVTTQQAP